MIRLNKYLAHNSGISRRQADEVIEQGRVRVNGEIASLGAQIGPEDTVSLDGNVIEPSRTYTYIALHKPIGYVCSRRAQGDSATIYELLPTSLHHLKSVGRLDKDSSGILLLTDDGDFAHQMTHPRFYKTKIYKIKLDQPLAPLHQQMINDYGVHLEDGPSKLQLEPMDDTKTTWRVTMHEGRNRQIRRTFDSLGYTVTALHRTHFGAYSLSNLAPGKSKIISK